MSDKTLDIANGTAKYSCKTASGKKLG